MLLSYDELYALVARGVIKDVPLENINSASIDITLGDTFMVEDRMEHKVPYKVNLRRREPLRMSKFKLEHGKFLLHPGQFILAQSKEVFNLPYDISAEYKLKSSMARIGLNHCLAGWCDAGWHGSVLTLELMNVTKNHVIELEAGDKIGQMIFFNHRPVPQERSYEARGRYNNDIETQGAKE